MPKIKGLTARYFKFPKFSFPIGCYSDTGQLTAHGGGELCDACYPIFDANYKFLGRTYNFKFNQLNGGGLEIDTNEVEELPLNAVLGNISAFVSERTKQQVVYNLCGMVIQ